MAVKEEKIKKDTNSTLEIMVIASLMIGISSILGGKNVVLIKI